MLRISSCCIIRPCSYNTSEVEYISCNSTFIRPVDCAITSHRRSRIHFQHPGSQICIETDIQPPDLETMSRRLNLRPELSEFAANTCHCGPHDSYAEFVYLCPDLVW